MLLINDEPVRAADLFGKKGFLPKPKKQSKFKLHKSLVKYSKVNEKYIHPASHLIEATYDIVKKNGESLQIRYYKTKTRGKNGEDIYKPEYAESFNSNNPIIPPENDPDLLFFLLHHPRNASSPFRNKNKKPLYFLEDKQKAAEERNEKRKRQLAAESMLYGENAMSKEKLIEVARAHGISHAEDMSRDQLTDTLYPYAKNNPDKFIKNTQGYDVKMRSLVMEASDLGIIKFFKKEKGWYTLTETGNKDERLCSVQYDQEKDPVGRLLNFMKNNVESGYLENLEEKIREAKDKSKASKEVESEI